jgi:hypothetical protein
MSYLDRLKAARAQNAPRSATLKTVERTGLGAFERFESYQSEHISGVPAESPQADDNVSVDEHGLTASNLRNSPAPQDYSPELWIDTLAGMEAFCA